MKVSLGELLRVNTIIINDNVNHSTLIIIWKRVHINVRYNDLSILSTLLKRTPPKRPWLCPVILVSLLTMTLIIGKPNQRYLLNDRKLNRNYNFNYIIKNLKEL